MIISRGTCTSSYPFGENFYSRLCHSVINYLNVGRGIRNFCSQTRIMNVLNVAEKNDAAKHIASFLSNGNSARREGLSKFNKIYEFDCQMRGRRAHMIMTSVSGHLLGIDFDQRYRSWKSCNPLVLFDAPIHKFCPDNYKNIKATLEREIRRCEMLIIWTDCDREGENIGFEIINVCKAKKPNIQVFRAKFSEITHQSVSRALQSLEQPNKRLSDAVDVRSELDLRIGAAFTRFQTLRLQQAFPTNLNDRLISYGSCQFPTLGFVVERYKAIERFIPEDFWKISVKHTSGKVTVDFLWKRVRLFDQLACQVLLDLVLENQTAVVEKVVSKPKSKWRPVPLDTIELEKQGSKKLKLNAKETMKIAERLYTQGIISYPRTETNIFPKEMNLSNLVTLQIPDNRWGGFAQLVLDSGPNPRQGKKSDQAHPPIHPTKYVGNLQGNDGRVYEFIVRHFLACCSKDALGQETIVDIDISGEKFVASGLQILERNYLDVYPYENWSSKEILPYTQGQEFQPSKIEMTDGKTSAPKLLTEADLIALMEKHGIGTDATHAEHIETIKNRSYVGLDHIYFLPGELGLGLVDGYDSMGFQMSKPNLRAELEADLQKISEGIRNPQEVLTEQLAKYKQVFTIALQQAQKIDAALAKHLNEAVQPVANDFAAQDDQPAFKTVCSCSLCGSDMVLKSKRDNSGFFVSCVSYPHCKNAIWLPSTVEACDVLEESCSQCNRNTMLLRFQFKRGSYMPMYPDIYNGCVGGCNPDFLELLRIRQPNHGNGLNRNADFRQANSDNRVPSTGSNFSDSGFSSFPTLQPNSSVSQNASQRSTGFTQSTRNDSQSSRSGSTGSSITNSGVSRPSTLNIPNRISDAGADAIVCQCNIDASKFTVRKEGPNQGREFYSCGNRSACKFFLWADESNALTPPARANLPVRTNPPSRTNPPPRTNSTTVQRDSGEDQDVKCACGDTAKSLTVTKDNANKGRKFYACAKPRDSQCDFFQWFDDNESGKPKSNSGQWKGSSGSSGNWSSSSNTRGSMGNRGRGKRSGTSSGTKRKCGNCGQPGHIRTKCPNQ